jgi:drug/metabolite transporter (DMT)-like permease
MDCHLFTTGAGLRAGLHFLAVCGSQRHDAGDSAGNPSSAPLALRDHLFCVLQGCCVFCFNFWCFYTAAAHINTGLESVIFSMAVLFNAINGFIFFRQQPPARFWLAAALGLVGIITLFWDDLLSNGLNASLLWGIGLSALGTYGFSSAICSVCATSAVGWKP